MPQSHQRRETQRETGKVSSIQLLQLNVTQSHSYIHVIAWILYVGRKEGTSPAHTEGRESPQGSITKRQGAADRPPHCWQHLLILTSSRSIINEKDDPIYLKSLKKNVHFTFSLFHPQ